MMLPMYVKSYSLPSSNFLLSLLLPAHPIQPDFLQYFSPAFPPQMSNILDNFCITASRFTVVC